MRPYTNRRHATRIDIVSPGCNSQRYTPSITETHTPAFLTFLHASYVQSFTPNAHEVEKTCDVAVGQTRNSDSEISPAVYSDGARRMHSCAKDLIAISLEVDS
jgi:hypothetical protein